MNLLGFSAEASVYRTSNTYHAAYGTPADNASATVIPQQCRCVRWVCPPPPRCPIGWRCCEPAPGGGCFLCVPPGALCP
jgi:hypothetical protein